MKILVLCHFNKLGSTVNNIYAVYAVQTFVII